MVTDGTFASTFFLHILTNTSAANAYVNAITPGTYNLSPSGMCNFNPGGTGTDSGIQGDAMSCSISTGYTPSTGGAMADQFAAGVCILNSRTTSQAWVDMAAFDGSSLIYIDPYDDTFYFRMDVFSASFANVFNPGGTQGSWAVARYGANTSLYQNGAFFGSPSADTFTQITEAPILILAASFGNFSGDTLGYDFAGNLTAGQVTLVYNRLHTMEVALGNSQC
jgi:hypothetical protein